MEQWWTEITNCPTSCCVRHALLPCKPVFCSSVSAIRSITGRTLCPSSVPQKMLRMVPSPRLTLAASGLNASPHPQGRVCVHAARYCAARGRWLRCSVRVLFLLPAQATPQGIDALLNSERHLIPLLSVKEAMKKKALILWQGVCGGGGTVFSKIPHPRTQVCDRVANNESTRKVSTGRFLLCAQPGVPALQGGRRPTSRTPS